MRRARGGRTLMVIERRGFCEGAMSLQRKVMWERARLKTHDKFCGGGNAGHLMPCVLGFLRR